jgi:hypothetical protein
MLTDGKAITSRLTASMRTGQLRLADISNMIGNGVAVSYKVTPLSHVEQKIRVPERKR